MSYKENNQIIIIILWSNLKWEKPCFTSFTSLLLLANIGLDEEQEVRKLKGGKTQHEGGVKKAERGGGKKIQNKATTFQWMRKQYQMFQLWWWWWCRAQNQTIHLKQE